MTQGSYYKEVLQKEISELSEHDITFLVKLISIIRLHKKRK